MADTKIENVAFEIEGHSGFSVKASRLMQPNDGDALIEIFRDGKAFREFRYPAYRIYNIAAHFGDIVDEILEKEATEMGKEAK